MVTCFRPQKTSDLVLGEAYRHHLFGFAFVQELSGLIVTSLILCL